MSRNPAGLAARTALFALVLALPLLTTACEGDHFSQPMTLGGETYTAEKLNAGWAAYTEYCSPCHGVKGDGKGLSSVALWPVPRDFTKGQFEFGSVPPGSLPTDADLVRLIRNGLAGTAMLAWDIPEPQLGEIIGYIKTLSPRWQTEKPGDPVPQSADPWPAAGDGGQDAAAVQRGEFLYVRAGCNGCHATFVTKQKFFDLMTTGSPGFQNAYASLDSATIGGLVNDISYMPTPKPSDVFGEVLIPPDFTRDPIRSGTGHLVDGQVVTTPIDQLFPMPEIAEPVPADVFRILSVGLNGAAMPSFSGAFPDGDKDLWALAHYVVHLSRMRGTQAAYELHESLAHQPPFTPPASQPASQPASLPAKD